MANVIHPMDIKQIISLKRDKVSNRKIEKLLGIHRNTINEYVHKIESSGYHYEELLSMHEGRIRELFTTKTTIINERYARLMDYFDHHDLQLKHPGFNAQYHYFEYADKVPNAYGYTQFMEHFNRRYKPPKGSMKLNHPAGEKVLVDFAGKKLHLTDRSTGELISVEVFVAILPCSQYTYVAALHSQKKEDVLQCMEKALHYFGGSPKGIVTDNFKAAVNKSSKFEAEINRSFKDFARHYDCAISPTRSYSPQDKALVESAVNLVYQRIYYPLRAMTFFTLEELNKAIYEQLEDYNDQILQLKGASRRELFQAFEKETLKPLPSAPFELVEYRRAKVQKIGYVYFSEGKNYYSVPYRYIGKQVQIHYTQSTIEVYYEHDRIAIHRRSLQKGSYTTQKHHLSSQHQAYSDWSPEYFEQKAALHGPGVQAYINRLIKHFEFPEIGYKRALGIIQLHKVFSSERLNKACEYALQGNSHSYQHIKNILENKLDLALEEDDPPAEIPVHENIRGAEAYL